MKNIPITLTMPEDLVRDLHLYIAKRKVSKFITELVYKQIEVEKQKIAQEFREASQDVERNKELEIWDTVIGDGLDATNDY